MAGGRTWTRIWSPPRKGVRAKVGKIGAVFSSGGSQPLYSVPAGATGVVALNWPTDLPAPTLSGNVATYHDVQPGVDLVVTSGVTGFDLRSCSPRGQRRRPTFQLPVTLAGGVTSTQGSDGVVRYSAADGTPVLVSDAPRMWDATRFGLRAADRQFERSDRLGTERRRVDVDGLATSDFPKRSLDDVSGDDRPRLVADDRRTTAISTPSHQVATAITTTCPKQMV